MEEWKKALKERYKKLKEEGKPFFPFAIFKDTTVALLILLLLVVLALKFGAPLEAPADPNDTTYNPRPEWYFLFLFQALKFFPGKLEAIAAVVLPGVAVFLLFFLPFLDRNRARHPFDRPVSTSLALVALGAIVFLTLTGAKAPMTNIQLEKDPASLRGQALYAGLRCASCHSIEGTGGLVGPDLTSSASRREEGWIMQHLKDPKSVSPTTVMPNFNLMDEEIKDITVYLKSLSGSGGPFTPQAKVLFAENCFDCHKMGTEGGEVGPDLTAVGSYRDKTYIYKYTEDPTQLNKEATMSGYKDILTPDQIEDVSRYLAAQRGKK